MYIYKNCKLYADDIQLYSIVDQCELRDMQSQLDALQQWSDTWQLSYFIQEMQCFVFG